MINGFNIQEPEYPAKNSPKFASDKLTPTGTFPKFQIRIIKADTKTGIIF